MKLLIQNANPVNKKIKILASLAIRFAFLVLLFVILNPAACKKEDLGKCTIMTYSGDLVYEKISIEECQNIFYDTPGVQGWKWEPRN